MLKTLQKKKLELVLHWVSGLQKSWHKNTKNVFVVEMHWKINKEVYEAAFSETANQKVLKTTGGVLSLQQESQRWLENITEEKAVLKGITLI